MTCDEVNRAFVEALQSLTKWWRPKRKDRIILALCWDHFGRCETCRAAQDKMIEEIGGHEKLDQILLDPEKRALLRTEEGRKQLAVESRR